MNITIAIILAISRYSYCQTISTGTSINERIQREYIESAVKELQSGRPTITGAPSFKSSVTFLTTGQGIVWADGSTSTTANTGNSISLSANNVWTGNNNFGWAVGLGRSTGTLPGASYEYIYAKSADGAVQSTGCVGVLFSGGFGQELVWTSTTTDNTNRPTVVLAESCTPLAVCKYQIRGFVQAQCNSGLTIGAGLVTSTVRCQGTNNTGATLYGNGQILAQSGNICDVLLDR